jgi:hypothetical protein
MSIGTGRGIGGLVAAEVVYDATKLAPRGLPSKHEAIPAAQEAWHGRSRMLRTSENPQGGGRLRGYQKETAEKTPAAATVCSRVSFFACIAR